MLWLFTRLLTSIPECIANVDIIFIIALCIVFIAIGFLNKLSKGGN